MAAVFSRLQNPHPGTLHLAPPLPGRKVALSALLLSLALGIVGVWAGMHVEAPEEGPIASAVPPGWFAPDVSTAIDGLSPSASGMGFEMPSAIGRQANELRRVEGTLATGRVDRLYLRAADGVLLDPAAAPSNLQNAPRFAAIEFPDPLANGLTLTRVLVPEGLENVKPGDVVEMRFADNPVRSEEHTSELQSH